MHNTSLIVKPLLAGAKLLPGKVQFTMFPQYEATVCV